MTTFAEVAALLDVPLAAYGAKADSGSITTLERTARELILDIHAAASTFAAARGLRAPSLEAIAQADTFALGHTDWRTEMAVQLQRLLAS